MLQHKFRSPALAALALVAASCDASMALIKSSRVMAASEIVPNLLAGSVYEFVPQESIVAIGILASVAGFQAAVSSGSDILLEDGSVIDVVRVAGQGPIYPDDFALQDVALPGDRLRISVRAPVAGGTVFYAVRTEPVG